MKMLVVNNVMDLLINSVINPSVFDGLKKSDRSLDSFTKKQNNRHTIANNVIVKSEPPTTI